MLKRELVVSIIKSRHTHDFHEVGYMRCLDLAPVPTSVVLFCIYAEDAEQAEQHRRIKRKANDQINVFVH